LPAVSCPSPVHGTPGTKFFKDRGDLRRTEVAAFSDANIMMHDAGGERVGLISNVEDGRRASSVFERGNPEPGSILNHLVRLDCFRATSISILSWQRILSKVVTGTLGNLILKSMHFGMRTTVIPLICREKQEMAARIYK
jgi:hypothetical protein